MRTVEAFEQKRRQTVEVLEQLLSFVKAGAQFGITPDEKVIDKITAEIQSVQAEKLKVALIGGFSEGKTSIVAAWSGNYDPTMMKIDPAESTDQISVYDIGDFELIDTPGLFGFKETANQEKYKNITRRYISEANLILYVMGPSNPIKESHRAELEWLFKDLNLLPRTVFVISRFDEEVDIEDEDEYVARFTIKRKNVLTRLREFDLISETATVPIVAVAANPFGEGFKYWESNMDEYHKISHIDDLQLATSERIEASGGAEGLIAKTKETVVRDVIKQEMPVAEATIKRTLREHEQLSGMTNDIQRELAQMRKKIAESSANFADWLVDYLANIIMEMNGASLETIEGILTKNIGDQGITLNTHVQNEFARAFDDVDRNLERAAGSFNTSVKHYNTMMGDLARKGIKSGADMLKNVEISKDAIFSMRDAVMPSIKFKPSGGKNLADGLNTGAAALGAILGVGIEVWDSYTAVQQERELQRVKKEIKHDLEAAQSKWLALLKDKERFAKRFYPVYVEMTTRLAGFQKDLDSNDAYRQALERWIQQGKEIEGHVL